MREIFSKGNNLSTYETYRMYTDLSFEIQCVRNKLYMDLMVRESQCTIRKYENEREGMNEKEREKKYRGASG